MGDWEAQGGRAALKAAAERNINGDWPGWFFGQMAGSYRYGGDPTPPQELTTRQNSIQVQTKIGFS